MESVAAVAEPSLTTLALGVNKKNILYLEIIEVRGYYSASIR